MWNFWTGKIIDSKVAWVMPDNLFFFCFALQLMLLNSAQIPGIYNSLVVEQCKKSTDPPLENRNTCSLAAMGTYVHVPAPRMQTCQQCQDTDMTSSAALQQPHEEHLGVAACCPFLLSHGMRNCMQYYGSSPPHPVLQPQTSSDA